MPLTRFYNTNLTPELRSLKEEIEGYARDYGLDFYETIFEVIDADDLNEIAAYGGFPTRYPHWSFGMAYEELKKSYDYGLSKIYEMVINNDPCYAYLMRCNHVVDQKLVMAHVYAHCLAPETLIETHSGAKVITDVRVGDEVLSHTGTYRRVRACARRQFSGKILRMTFSGSSEVIRITAEHPVYLLSERTPPQRSLKPFSRWIKVWTPAGDVRVGDRVVLNRTLAPVGAPEGGGDYLDVAYGDSPDTDLYPEVESVETEDYSGYVYNFSVDTDESYTLAAGMVVHNCDFFKNNAYFAHTNRKMMDEIANHGARVRRYAEKYGEDEVEAFMDRCLSIDDLIDIHSTAIRRRDDHSRYDFTPDQEEGPKLTRFKSKEFMDEFINPPAALKAEEEEGRKQREQTVQQFPEQPEKDVLQFLIEYAPIKPWQRDVLSIVRDEAYYFSPQGQTKIINEGWACIVRSSYLLTDRGLLTAGEVVDGRLPVRVSDGKGPRAVYDWAKFSDRETVRATTRRGLELEGSLTHQVMLPDGMWKSLGEIRVGDRVKMPLGTDLWATEYQAISWRPTDRRKTMIDVAQEAGVSPFTLIRYREGRGTSQATAARLAPYLSAYETELAVKSVMHNKRRAIRVPDQLDERLAQFLGYLIGDGHISDVKRCIGLTTGDEEQADQFAALLRELFGLEPRKKWDQTKWRVLVSSRQLQEFLIHLGLETGVAARKKAVPDLVLRSPKPVVAAFLRALYDCDGYAGKAGVILSTSSAMMSRVVQLLLLNFGVLSTRVPHKDGCWHVHTLGRACEVFEREIGFGLERKRAALRRYLDSHRWFKEQPAEDEIVSVERGRADVFDFSVEETHRYVAGGFINHNSYWHSTMMTQKILQPSEVIDYADHHSGTVAMHGARLNPYKLGLELLRDIEHRWNTGRFGPEYDACDDLEKRRTWDKQLGLGRQKIFEVRRVHNDITFIDTFLTPEFCREQKLFSFAFAEPTQNYVIESREFQKVKQRLLFSLTNFGKPWIYVVNGNHRNRGELLLKHSHNGLDLKLNYAQDVLANLQYIWTRPVHLETILEGKPCLLSFDGQEHTTKPIGDTDDIRRSPPPKTR